MSRDASLPPGAAALDVAMFCDLRGIVQEFVLGRLHDAAKEVGRPFLALIDRHSHEKAERFLAAIRNEGATAGWELTSDARYGLKSMVFTGIRSDERLLIMGARTHTQLDRILSELRSINSEQTNTIRELLKRHQQMVRESRAQTDESLDRFSEMNNELMNAQRELQKKTIELERLNEEKNYFLAMAAHDLRNPLTLISGYSELMRQGDRSDEDLTILEEIHRSSRFMLRLIDDLLDVSKIEAGKYELQRVEAPLQTLVKESIDRLRVVAKQKNQSIGFEVTGDPAPVLVDPLKIEQILGNLVMNAIKYSNDGTQILVSVCPRDTDVELTVADQGPGIPADELERIFQPFQQFSMSGTAGEKSTGVGLMIIKRLVEMHDGRVWVESEVGTGSSFHVRLPAIRRDS